MAAKRKNYARKLDMEPVDGLPSGVVFKFTDGRRLMLALAELSPAIVATAACHGLKQKVGDSWNKANTVDEAHDTGAERIRLLKAGTWNQSGGFVPIADEWITAAVAELRSTPVEAIRAKWEGFTDDVKDGIRADSRVKATAERLRAESRIASAEAPTEADPLAAFGDEAPPAA